MGNLLKRLLSKLLTSELDKRKEILRAKLQAQINTTSSSWVKTRNQLYIDLLEIASETMVNKMEKEILK
ncbi:hypothetical protein CJ260_05995 [Megasphaera sp. ASD88]|uniref:hypothetical protein n=1 Tax=Megasphaera sp. ASD88 TaxID=2027407 RepID=UPI000BABE4F3|nr:hypothetical protein [Megasphaera sp. ASD88]MDN0047514.1 hypothetical protein [Megasphaera hexanoica]PAV39137.1 hypothetical protein CJ260_05995 [Megasphaera sp. ASD88]